MGWSSPSQCVPYTKIGSSVAQTSRSADRLLRRATAPPLASPPPAAVVHPIAVFPQKRWLLNSMKEDVINTCFYNSASSSPQGAGETAAAQAWPCDGPTAAGSVASSKPQRLWACLRARLADSSESADPPPKKIAGAERSPDAHRLACGCRCLTAHEGDAARGGPPAGRAMRLSAPPDRRLTRGPCPCEARARLGAPPPKGAARRAAPR